MDGDSSGRRRPFVADSFESFGWSTRSVGPCLARRLCRKEIFRRDDYTCQYCGKQTHHLTMDHVVPRHRSGEHLWTTW